MDIGRVLHRDDQMTLGTTEAEIGHGTSRIGEQPLSVRRIGPRPRDHLGPVERAHVGLVVLDDLVDDAGIDEALLNQ